jgi:hypothetical protein
MKPIVNKNDVVSRNEKAVVIFTRGLETTLNHINDSTTGDWKIDDDREFDTVVIYHQDETTKVNTILSGEYKSRTPKDSEGRVILTIKDVCNIGTTESNWIEFCMNKAGASNPVQYVD